MKMVMISADDYDKLSNAKKEAETKIGSYKQCVAGYESRIKELTEELDKLKNAYRPASIKEVLNSAYGTEQDVCCRISNALNKSMFDKITGLSNENEKLKKESAEKSEWLKAKNEALDNLIIAHNKLEKENKELKASTVSFECHKKLIEDNERLADENEKLKDEKQNLKCNNSLFKEEIENLKKEIKELKFKKGCLDTVIYTNKVHIDRLAKENDELKATEWIKNNEKLANKNHKLEIKVSSLETELKDCKYMYENKLKNTEASLSAASIDNRVNDLFIETLRSQAEEDANKIKELRQKYEAILKANEKLAAENQRLTNNPETTKLNSELTALKKQYRDLNNAYKSQKNELSNRKKLLKDVALELNNIYEHTKTEASHIEMLAIDLRSFMI